MNSAARSIRWALLGVVAVLVPTEAYAYIDPGTGSYVVQAIVAAVAGGAMAMRMYWDRVKAFLRGEASEDDVDPGNVERGPADE
ncbi:MAG: hypothetical protein VX246_00465 [Myxococcota bacterium]|nr:hypothetical protein [Myxococcota bacterium]